jgi:hypothetical protein
MLDACDYNNFGDVCDPQTNTCKQAVKLVAAGQPCGTVGGVPTECEAFGSCVYDTPDPAVGTCHAVIPPGSPCDPTGAVLCDLYATCVNGTCKLIDPNLTCP